MVAVSFLLNYLLWSIIRIWSIIRYNRVVEICGKIRNSTSFDFDVFLINYIACIVVKNDFPSQKMNFSGPKQNFHSSNSKTYPCSMSVSRLVSSMPCLTQLSSTNSFLFQQILLNKYLRIFTDLRP